MTDSLAEVLVPNSVTARLWTNGTECDARTEFDQLMQKFWKLMEGQFWIQREFPTPTRHWRSLVAEAMALYQLAAVQDYFEERHALYSVEFIEFLKARSIDGDPPG